MSRTGHKKFFSRGILLLAAVICLSPPASRPAEAADDKLRALLDRHGLCESCADRIIRRYEECKHNGLPPESLLNRLREGLAKQADPACLADALERRREALARARDISSRGRFRRHPRGGDLLETLADALESGVPAEAFEGLLKPGHRRLSNRISTIVKAGEMLHLAGVETEDVRWFMHEARKPEWRRREILRAARYWTRLHRKGLESREIRERIGDEGFMQSPLSGTRRAPGSNGTRNPKPDASSGMTR